jgi:hypothetical protein
MLGIDFLPIDSWKIPQREDASFLPRQLPLKVQLHDTRPQH